MLVTTPSELEELEAPEEPAELDELDVRLEPPAYDELRDVEPDEGLLVRVGVGRGFGVAVTLNGMLLVAVPTDVVTVMGPLVAWAGTMVLSCVSLSTW
jgi:hypothetical protein